MGVGPNEAAIFSCFMRDKSLKMGFLHYFCSKIISNGKKISSVRLGNEAAAPQ
jgi:hypothetical protein